MKSLEDFRLICTFLRSQGIQPSVGMVALDSDSWADLVLMAKEWAEEKPEAEVETDPAILEMQAKQEAAERKLETDRLLYHSSGYKPKRNENV